MAFVSHLCSRSLSNFGRKSTCWERRGFLRGPHVERRLRVGVLAAFGEESHFPPPPPPPPPPHPFFLDIICLVGFSSPWIGLTL